MGAQSGALGVILGSQTLTWPFPLGDSPTPSHPPPFRIPQALSFREVSGFREEDGGLIGQDFSFTECEAQAKQSFKSTTLFNLHQNPVRDILQLQSSLEGEMEAQNGLARATQVMNIPDRGLN